MDENEIKNSKKVYISVTKKFYEVKNNTSKNNKPGKIKGLWGK